MAFDPSKGSGGGFKNYANPYAPQPPTPQKKNGPHVVIFIMISILVLGLVAGALLFVNMNKKPSNLEQNPNSVVDDSKFTEVEIFDVKTK